MLFRSIDAVAAAAEVERVARATDPFPLMLRTAAPTLDEAADGWRVDLLPDDGKAQLIALRAALGGGGLFAPYLPVARGDRDACEGLAAHLCQQDLEVAATVAALALVQWDADEARVLATCALQS